MLTRPAQNGLTLIELLVGSALGLLILSSLLGLYATTVHRSGEGLRAAQLQQELRAVLGILRQDLRRAGYLGVTPAAASLPLLRANPFTDADDPDKPVAERNDVRLGQYPGEGADSCILYSYDLDGDGDLTPSGTGMERFGFRLRDGRMQMRHGGTSFDCTDGSWQSVTAPPIEITRLHFRLEGTPVHPQLGEHACTGGEPCLQVRSVRIQLRGRLRTDPAVHMILHDRVRLRNDRYLANL
jgi:prepilin peptidase dependent protein B